MGSTPDDVERALDAARVGDPDALGVLWRAHQPQLLRYMRGRGIADADDLATQVWIDAARNLPRFRGGADDFRRWLFTIAHRRVVDEHRQLARRRNAPLPVPEPSPGADESFDEHDSLARALALVRQLPDPMCEAVLLRIVADLSVDETAGVMGLRPGHVRVLVHRGLRRLEQLVARDASGVTTGEAQTMERST